MWLECIAASLMQLWKDRKDEAYNFKDDIIISTAFRVTITVDYNSTIGKEL